MNTPVAFVPMKKKREPEAWGVPADLWSTLAPVPPLPRGLLPATLEAFAFGKPETHSPAAMAAAALATCSMAASDNLRLALNATWHERFCIWVGLAGPSSAKKTPPVNAATRPLAAEQQRRGEEFREELAAWKKAKKNQAPDDLLEPEPVAVRYFTNNATIEALTVLESHSDHGVGLVHDELSALIAAMDGPYKEKSGSERGHWLKLYDGGEFYSDRITRGPTHVKNHSAAVLGGITTNKLASLVNTSVADGLMSRFSLTLVPVTTPSTDLDAMPHEAYVAYEKLIGRLVQSRPEEVREVMLAAEAKGVLGEAQLRWQTQAVLYDENVPRYAERLGKLPGLAARIGLGFAIVEAAEHGDTARIVTAPQMQRAVAYVDYQSQHDLTFYATAAGQDTAPAVVMARRVGSWLLQHNRASFLVGDVTKGINEWRALRALEQLGAMELLIQMGWVRPGEEEYFSGLRFVRGTPWLVNPAVHTTYEQRATVARQMAAEQKRRLTANVEHHRAAATGEGT